MYPSEENVCFSLLLTVSSRKGTLFKLFFKFQNRKSVPFRGKCMFFTPFDCFSRKGALFLLFSHFNIKKKSVPFRGKCMVFNPFDGFSRTGTFFLFFKFQNMRFSSKTLKFKRPRCLPQQFGVTQGVFYTKWHHHKMIGPRVCDFLQKH